jgi:Ni/Fe-hydrogenase 1 B-type cytochrome subunit
MATFTKTPNAVVRSVHRSEIVPIYVWEWPVRVFHWTVVVSLTVLTVTGFYLHGPFVVSVGPRAWVMGTTRFVHELFGFILIAALVLRYYWFFVGNQWARWRAWLPLTREQWRNVKSMILYYTFMQHKLEPEIGHNALAGSTYVVIMTLLVWECISGLVLYSAVLGSHTLSLLFGWIPRIIDIQYVRLSHYFVMYLFMAFVIHHVYSAILCSKKLRNGLMESIFTGRKFIPRDVLEEQGVEPDMHLHLPRSKTASGKHGSTR